MKHIARGMVIALIICVALVCPTAGAEASGDGIVTRRALIIGNVNYSGGFNRLPGSDMDAYRMGAVARSARFDGNAFERVEVYIDRTVRQILRLANDLAAWGQDGDDVTLFYFSGHGMEKDAHISEPSIAGIDSSEADPTAHPPVYFKDLAEVFDKIPGQVVLLIDACHSGGAIGKSIEAASPNCFNNRVISLFSNSRSKAAFDKTKYKVITSCASNEMSAGSFIAGTLGGSFTTPMVEGAGIDYSTGAAYKNMPADADNDGVVTLNEAYVYAGTNAKYFNAGQNAQVYPQNSDFALFARTEAAITALLPAKATLHDGGQTVQLAAAMSGSRSASEVIWTSDDESVATVDSNGLVTGVKAGKCKITATCGKTSLSSVITVKKHAVKSISLDANSVDIKLYEARKMLVTYKPATTTQRKLKWSSSNPLVATVSEDGTIRALGLGKAIITAKAQNGKKARVNVNVVSPIVLDDFTLSAAKLTITEGMSAALTAKFTPEDASDRYIYWDTSNASVASVNDHGIIKGNATGSAVITATTLGGVKRACDVTVVRNERTFKNDENPSNWDPHTPLPVSNGIYYTVEKMYYTGDYLCCDFYLANTGSPYGDSVALGLDHPYVYICKWGDTPIDPDERETVAHGFCESVTFEKPVNKGENTTFTLKLPRERAQNLDLATGGYKIFISTVVKTD
ncbi:MAG: Ig-like domain-containing protein [Clostridia bacterium]|nr:Ig-like domain-containing protein [Clostridia bacterium]